jgi:predicted porin
MKKSLFAIAAVTAFAGAAQAQSSVTVYGILDVGFMGGNQKATVNNTKSAETVAGFNQSGQASSRLGFRGTEDLGGGTAAFFTAEVDLTPTTSTLISGNRQTFVGLSQKGIGRAAIGTQYTLLHDATGPTSPTQNNNIVGDVIYPRNTGLGGADSNANGTSIGYTVRTNNAIKFNSDSFSGFRVNAFYNALNKDQNQGTTTAGATTGGTTNTNGYGISADYTWKKLLVNGAYQSFKQETDANTAAAVAAAASALSSGVVANATDNQYYFGATYDFGILKAYAQYLNRKVTSVYNSNAYASRSAQQIGVRAMLAPKVEAWASAGNGRFSNAGIAQPTANFVGYQVGANYLLSKRTNLYAIFGATGTSSTSTSSGVSNFNANNYGIGARHTF